MQRNFLTIRSLLAATAAIAIGFAVYVWATKPRPPIPVTPTSRADIPVVAIFQHAGAMNIASAYHGPYCEFALWIDGSIVWREFPSDPNSRMLTTSVDKAIVGELFVQLSRSRLLDPDMNWQYLGPDSNYVSIEIMTEYKLVELASWHEEPGHTTFYDNEYEILLDNWRAIRRIVTKLTDRNGREYNGLAVEPTPGINKNGG